MDKPRFMLDSNILIDVLNGRLDLAAFLDTLPDCELYEAVPKLQFLEQLP
jgi:hypothetical protein